MKKKVKSKITDELVNYIENYELAKESFNHKDKEAMNSIEKLYF